ncbi:MAG: ATP-binding protein [Caldilineaceae bacterium]
MANPTDILTIIAAGESEAVAFKRMIDNPESIAGEIVAFANSNGGTLLFGVEDNGAILVTRSLV